MEKPPRVHEVHTPDFAMRASLGRRPILFALLAVVVLAAGGASAEYVRVRSVRVAHEAVVAEITSLLRADSTAGDLDEEVHALYASAQPLWRSPDDRGTVLELLSRADRDGLEVDSALADLRALADTASTAASDARIDLGLTAALVRHGRALQTPRADARRLYGYNWTSAHSDLEDVAGPLREAVAADELSLEDALEGWASSLRPQHPGYRSLRAALSRELDLEDAPLLNQDLSPGDSSTDVTDARARLALEGDLDATVASELYDQGLADAVQSFQARRGLATTRHLDPATREILNERRPELIPLLTLNLERWRWLPRDLGDLHVWVNVPRFELALRERSGAGWTEAIRFRAVVGASDWETPSFTDTLESVVFNPTWIVPASIQRESYGVVRGRVVRPPGPGNAMGRVKFLFPNDHAVYVHDTPSKWSFGVDDRARSHGCVRAGDPEGLARELLTRTNGWEAERVEAIFNGPWSRTEHVQVEGTVPVHLAYFTAEVDHDGRLLLFDDVYRRDARLAKALGLEIAPITEATRASLIADRIGDEDEVAAELSSLEEDDETDLEDETEEAPAPDSAAVLENGTLPALENR